MRRHEIAKCLSISILRSKASKIFSHFYTMNDWCVLALHFLSIRDSLPVVEDPGLLYGVSWEEYETREIVAFVESARKEVSKRAEFRYKNPGVVRISKTLRIYIEDKEVKIRPMAKSILLLFLRHPEGIPLKKISNYRQELSSLYGRISRSSDRRIIAGRVAKIEDIFNNELNVNIARINSAINTMVESPDAAKYRIEGEAGKCKKIPIDRTLVIWE